MQFFICLRPYDISMQFVQCISIIMYIGGLKRYLWSLGYLKNTRNIQCYWINLCVWRRAWIFSSTSNWVDHKYIDMFNVPTLWIRIIYMYNSIEKIYPSYYLFTQQCCLDRYYEMPKYLFYLVYGVLRIWKFIIIIWRWLNQRTPSY